MVKITRFSSKINLTLSVVLLLVSLGLLFYFGSITSTAKSKVVQQKENLAELKNDLATLDTVLEENKVYQERVDLVVKTLPTSYQDVAFYAAQLERIADASTQTLETTIDKTAKDEKDGTSSLKLELKTSGGYNSYSQMLTGLSELPYHTRVDSLKVDKDGSRVATLINFRLFIFENE